MKKNPLYPVNTSKLLERESYPFIFHAEIVMPDGEKKYVLTDPFGIRHMLSYELYKHYGFEKGQQIQIRVDKISCSGKIYLEPAHPHYREGEWYDFSFLRSEIRENIFGIMETVWILQDISQQEIAIAMQAGVETPLSGELIQCKVNRIKKAHISLSHPQAKTNKGLLQTGSWHVFRIENKEVIIDDIPYFVLLDHSGHHHLLKKRPFDDYNIKAGQEIQCKIVKWSNKGIYILEPQHPVYQENQDYHFDVLTTSDTTLLVLDVFGNDIELEATDPWPEEMGNTILLKVKEIRKGVPVLQLP